VVSKKVVIYGFLMALAVGIYKYLEYQFIAKSFSSDITLTLFAILFTVVGIWAGLKYGKSKKAKFEFKVDPEKRKDLNISDREFEVLELLASGLSNQEIADKLFVSLNTIKTHSSNLYSKLGAKRRTQAIEKARNMGILEAHTKV
jgi:NarL family two-component system response regulator LiaR